MKIIGATVGTTTPKPNFDQMDPRKGDFIKGDRTFITPDDTLAVAGRPADAKATGDVINQLQANIDEVAGLVGDFDNKYYTETEIDGKLDVITDGMNILEIETGKKENKFYKQVLEPVDAPSGSFWLASNVSKNLFYSNITSTVKNGVTVTFNQATQEIVLNGTLTSVGDLPLASGIDLDWVSGEYYTISVRHIDGTAELASGSSGTTYAWSIFNTNASKYMRGSTSLTSFNGMYNFTATAFIDSKYNIFLQCWRVGTVFDNYRVKIQIEKGSVVTDYEPYISNSNENSTLKYKNLKNEWTLVGSNDAIQYIEQNLTEEQMLQARENIGINLDDYITESSVGQLISDVREEFDEKLEEITNETIDAICGEEIEVAEDVMF